MGIGIVVTTDGDYNGEGRSRKATPFISVKLGTDLGPGC
jgi:hypothetical protein